MAITNIRTASNGGVTDTSPTITHGLTISSNDVIILAVHANNTPTISDNNGANAFTEVFQENNPAGGSRYAFYRRVAGASEPATYNFTLSASNVWSVFMIVVAGADTTTPLDVTPSATTRSNGSGTSPSAPSMTTLTDGALGLLWDMEDATATTPSAPTNGYADLVHVENRGQSVARQIWATAGATGSAGMTLSVGTNWVCHQFAIKPSVAAGPTPSITSINGGSDITTGATGVVTVGTDFEASQGTGNVTQQGISLTETAWTDTSITANTITVENTAAKYGSHTFQVTNDSGNSDSIAANVVPASGSSYVDLSGTLAASGDRITATPDLAAGDQLRYGNVLYSGGSPTAYTVTVNADASFVIGNGPVPDGTYTFNVRAWDAGDTSWGTAADQTVIISTGGGGGSSDQEDIVRNIISGLILDLVI